MAHSDPASPEDRRARNLHRLIRRADRLIDRAEQTGAAFTRWRLAIFLTGAGLTILAYKQAWYHLGNGLLGSFLLIFLAVAYSHGKLVEKLDRLLRWRGIKRAHRARLALDWTGIPARLGPPPEDHPYARDLDITGTHSLFHLLNTTLLSLGRERLAAWLLNQSERPPDPGAWRERQALAQELTGLPLFRDRLKLESHDPAVKADKGDWPEIDAARIQAMLSSAGGSGGLLPLLIPAGLLAALTWSLGLAAALNLLPGYWLFSFAAYAGLIFLSSGRTAAAFGRALALHHELNRLERVLGYLEQRCHAGRPALRRTCAPLLETRTPPSTWLGRLARVAQGLSLRAHPLVHVLVNALLPWDLFFAHRLEGLRQALKGALPVWLDCLAQVDAASAIGTFAWLHPDYHWPAPLEPEAGNGSAAAVTARALGHPLIPRSRRITNDLDLKGLGRILLITGSNMSGKSTFLRTLGINACLAQAGAPVCAAAFEWSWLRLACCIRVDDSLEAGLSFFYAEVKRLKRLLDAAGQRQAPPVLFLIDEIFKGTNNRERLIGSRAFIQALARSNGLGLLTTHDLELAQLEAELPGVTNAHFQETVEGQTLRFDYQLRPGPCPTTNALRIMALEGLPVPHPQG